MDKHIEVMFENFEFSHGPVTAQMFGNAGVEHMKKYGRIGNKKTAANSH
jgi:sterol carrier protein 2